MNKELPSNPETAWRAPDPLSGMTSGRSTLLRIIPRKAHNQCLCSSGMRVVQRGAPRRRASTRECSDERKAAVTDQDILQYSSCCVNEDTPVAIS